MADNLKIALKIFADVSQATGAIKSMGSTFNQLRKNLTDLFGAQALSAMKNYTFEAANLNKELTRISQTAGSGIKSIDGMNKAIFATAKSTGVSYKDIVGGYGKLAAGGLNLDEIQGAMKGISQAMVVSTANSEQLANAVMVASKSFGLDMTKDSTAILDKMYQAGKLGNAELEDLSTILSRVGPQAKLAGLGLEETLAFIEGMASSMESSEVVATMSRSVLKMFNDKNLRKKIEGMTGAQFFDSETGERSSAFDIFGAIQKSYLSMETDAQRSKFFEKAFEGADERTKNGLLSILGEEGSVDKMKGMWNEIGESSGAVKKDMNDMMNNLSSQTDRMKANFKEITIGAGSALDKVFTPMMKYANDVSEASGNNGVLSKGLLIGGGLLAAGGIAGKFGALKGLLGKGTAIGGAAGAAGGVLHGKLYEQMGITPVFVTNMPAGGIPGTNGVPGTGGSTTVIPAGLPGTPAAKGAAAKGAGWLGKAGGLLSKGAGAVGLTGTLAGLGVNLGGAVGFGTGAAGALAGAGAAGMAATGGLLVAAGGAGYGIGSLINVVSDAIAEGLTGKTLTDTVSDGLAAMFSKTFRANAKDEVLGIGGGTLEENREIIRKKQQEAERGREIAENINNNISINVELDKDGRLIDMRKVETKTFSTFGGMLTNRYNSYLY